MRALATVLSRPTPSALIALDAEVVDLADAHGVTPLLSQAVRDAHLRSLLSPTMLARLVRARREAVVAEASRHAHECATLAALASAGVDAIVFKGAALAVTHYEPAWLRLRGDVDLLVPVEQVEIAKDTLVRAGCREVPRPAGDFVTYQSRFASMSVPQGPVRPHYDLHWRVAEPQAFASVLDYTTLAAEAVPGPVTGARMASPRHALLIACVHRAAHHFDTDRLLLFCDIDRLACRFTREDWQHFITLARDASVRAVCLRGLDGAADLLGTSIPSWVREHLSGAGELEPSARFVGPALRKVDVLRSDLRQLDTWGARMSLLREHLCPARDYMAARYGAHHPLMAGPLILLLYAHRALRGAAGWFRPIR